MANYGGVGVSNWIRFSSPERVRKIVGYYNCDLEENYGADGSVDYAVVAQSDYGDIETHMDITDEDDQLQLIALGLLKKRLTDDDDWEDIELPDFMEMIASCLEPGQVFIWTHVGHERVSYLYGYAIAINSKKEKRTVDLNQIYLQAQELGQDTGYSGC